MDLWFHAVVLGLVQGLTEYLPISSTGHVRIAAVFLNIPDPGAAFSAVTQLGTALAVASYFRNDLLRMIKSLFGMNSHTSDRRLMNYMIFATAPIVIIGLLFADFFEDSARDLRIVATALIVFGVILFLADTFGSHAKNEDNLSIKSALLIGIAQTMALIPGVSRSGATMTMGRILGFDRLSAARISFLLSLPAIFLSAAYQLRFIGDESNFGWAQTLVASIVAFISGYLTIGFILKWLTKHSFTIFAVYRVLLGLGLIIGIIWFSIDPTR